MATNPAFLTVYCATMTFLLYHVEFPTTEPQLGILAAVMAIAFSVAAADFIMVMEETLP